MEPRTSKKDYKNHHYSGPKKNLKRSRGQMKRYHGEIKSRNEVWCKKPNKDKTLPSDAAKPAGKSTVKPLKTYTRVPTHHVKCDETVGNTSDAQDEPSIKNEESDYPLNDPISPSYDEPIEEEIVENLNGLMGNRIVDIQHVLTWAFALEKHKQYCQNSTIEFVSELRDGFNSVFTFKCSMCNKEFRKTNEQEEKLNKAFVQGTVASGSSYTQSAHLTDLMDIPTMKANKFKYIESQVTEEIENEREQMIDLLKVKDKKECSGVQISKERMCIIDLKF